jgi:hypothetical protein
MAVVAVAPCQCFSPGENQIASHRTSLPSGARSLGLPPSDRGLETLFVLVHVSLITLGIDKRIRIARNSLLHLLVFLGQVEERRVRTEEHSTGKARAFLKVARKSSIIPSAGVA